MRGPPSVSGRGGQEVRLGLRVKNLGDTVWLHAERPTGGYVRLGSHLAGPDGTTTILDPGRAPLSRDVGPGESVDVEIALALPRPRGRYRFVLDMVDEQVGWFEAFGSTPLGVDVEVKEPADSRTPSLLRAALRTEDALPVRLSKGAGATLRLRVTNAGDTVWLPATADGVGAVAVGGRLTDGAGATVRDHLRTPLPAVVLPGEEVSVACAIPRIAAPGDYVLRLDLVAEGVRWFAEDGSAPLSVPLIVA
jgi:hypothetical protein